MELKVGDRVRCNTERDTFKAIDGTIVEIRQPYEYGYDVLLENGRRASYSKDELDYLCSEDEAFKQYAKLPCEDFGKVLDELFELHEKKNHDYGDSFTTLFKEFGEVYAVGHIAEKVERLKTLLKAKNKVNESFRDSLIDCASYCIMTIVELDNRNGHSNETNKA